MHTDKSKILVVGGDGIIGGALTRTLLLARVQVCATTRRRERVREGVSFLDLAEPDWDALDYHVDVVYLCAALTDMRRCVADPAGTRRINVDNLCVLAKRCADRGARLV